MHVYCRRRWSLTRGQLESYFRNGDVYGSIYAVMYQVCGLFARHYCTLFTTPRLYILEGHSSQLTGAQCAAAPTEDGGR